VALARLDVERIPGRYSVPAGIICSLEALLGVVWAGSVEGRAISGVIFAALAAAMYWTFRRRFRKTLAKPLPRRGLKHWLLTLPGRLMVLAYLAYALALLGVTAGVIAMLHDRPAGFMLGACPAVMAGAWADAAAWLELRR
jgi:hypothetical protein